MDVRPCVFCGSQADSLFHLFSDCQFAHSVFSILKHKLDISFRFYDQWHIGSWHREGFDLGKQSCLTLRALIAYAFWMIWKARNDVLFSGKLVAPCSVFCKVVACVATHSVRIPPESTPGPPNQILVVWSPPNVGWCKLNVDGAYCKDSGLGGTGYLIQNDAGECLAAGCRFLENKDSLYAEMFVVLEGLRHTADEGVKSIVVSRTRLSSSKPSTRDPNHLGT
ncbi:uncharacterized protein LOC108952780 [Musa acuminata AAA Group]|uniref:uncharacterized protein LOC108952780 n=1 Tax=Musa acuminata AAA Group TaxID=214697 RepID=UPI0031E3C05D